MSGHGGEADVTEAVHIGAWCGVCGESFALVEVVDPAGDLPVGGCPRCGTPLAPGYTTVLVSAVRELLTAYAALTAAARQIHDVAPSLHVDRRQLTAELDETLEG